MPAKVYFLRHGQTDMNIRHMLQGRTDTHLNERGKEQAAAAGEFMRMHGIVPDRIITSPLVRTIETAEIATGKERSTFSKEELLIEMSFGDYEGTEVRNLDPEFYELFFHDPEHCKMPNQAETFLELYHRADLLAEKVKKENYTKNDTVLYVSHGAFLHALHMVTNNLPLDRFWEAPIDNCAILQAVWDGPNDMWIEPLFPGFAKSDYVDAEE